MPEIREIQDGLRTYTTDQVTRTYIITGVIDDPAAYALAFGSNEIPGADAFATGSQSWTRSITINEEATPDIPDAYRAAVTWDRIRGTQSNRERIPGSPPIVSYTVSGQQETAYISNGNVASYYAPGAPDQIQGKWGGLVGVSDSGIQGAPVFVPAVDMQETFVVTNQEFLDFLPVAAQLAYSVNDGVFRGMPPGEVLFLGVTGSQGAENANMVLSYRIAPNRGNFSVGQISGIAKLGHDYLWTRSGGSVTVSGQVIDTPLEAHVERFYLPRSFAGLPTR